MRKSMLLIVLIANIFFPANFVNAENDQTNIKEFSLTVYRNPGTQTLAPVIIRGDNLNVRGSYNSTYAPRACSPCDQNVNPSLNGILDINSSNHFSGYISGVFYPEIFPGGMLDYSVQQQPILIPLRWNKINRLSVPAVLTGSYIGFWTRRDDVGHLDRAVFVQHNISFTGFARLNLYWHLSPNYRRIYEDRRLSYEFSNTQ